MEINRKYSFKSLSEKSFKDVPATEFNGTIIKGSNFYHEMELDADIFPDGMKGVVFDGCNLDNILIPPGNTILPSCCARRIQAQHDLEDWFMKKDKNGKYVPDVPIRKRDFQELGLSIDPKDIPKQKMTEKIVKQKMREAVKNGAK